jgi:hypothetical protein
MPPCARCRKGLGEWQCAGCLAVVCTDCKTVSGGKVYCADHTPAPEAKPAPRLVALKKTILSIAILLAGMALIFYIGQSYIEQLPKAIVSPELLSAFRTVGILLIAGIGFILAILIMAYFVMGRLEH